MVNGRHRPSKKISPFEALVPDFTHVFLVSSTDISSLLTKEHLNKNMFVITQFTTSRLTRAQGQDPRTMYNAHKSLKT